MQGIIQPGDGADDIAERRMGRDIGHPLPVDVNFATIPQALHVFRAGIGPPRVGNDVLGAHGVLL
jgi:hypothetical protein